jgi:hypothetical protein
MVATFGELQKFLRAVTFERRSNHQWLMLRGYAFNLWLDATKNEELQTQITQTFSTCAQKKKRIRQQSSVVTNNVLSPLVGTKRNKIGHDDDLLPIPLTMEEVDDLVTRRATANDSTRTSGLASLLGSRKDMPVHLSNSKADDDVLRIEESDK